jgi:asparagine synthase (glutamine-hydrolysing)
VLTACDDFSGDPLIVCNGHDIAVGVARIDNRSDLERAVGADGSHLTDLQLVLRAVVRQGPACVTRILGDFGFVAWNTITQTGLAACDALSVKKLYYTGLNGLTAFADRATILAAWERYDLRYLAERVAGSEFSPGLTAFQGIKSVPGGSLVLLDRGQLTVQRYWSPDDLSLRPLPARSVPDTATELRDLLIESVRSRLGSEGDTWAQLSGGLDSSTVVSLAQRLAETGVNGRKLDGTVTYVDREMTASDEREYSNLVVDRWRLRNELIIDAPLWLDELHPPPLLDQPRVSFMFYPREYRLGEVVKRAGGRILLTGQGPDEYLRGSMFFFADWVAQGRILPAIREMARRAAIGRTSFWGLAYRNAITPLLPRLFQKRLGPEVTRLPPWVHPVIARRFQLQDRGYELTLNAGPAGDKHRHTVIKGVAALQATIGHLVLDDMLDVRHPFLDRRLVEFGLRLPPELTSQPYAGKWVLREAMRGILPEAVRTRVGKGTQLERHAWSLAAQRPLLEPLVHNPILADLGIVDGAKLRAAFDAAPRQPQRKGDPHAALQQVLAIEAWLQIRAGRWPRGLTK